MHQRLVTLHVQRFHHAQCRHRVDEARRTLSGCRPLIQHQTGVRVHTAILGKHLTAKCADGFTQQGLRGIGATRGDHGAGALVARRQRLPQARLHEAHSRGRNICGDNRTLSAAAIACGAHVGRPEQQGEVGRVDRRRLHAHQHLVGARLRQSYIFQPKRQGVVIVHARTQLQSSICHAGFLPL